MTTATTIGVTVTQIVVSGFLLGIGFWGSKKVTNYIDYRLGLKDARRHTKEYPYERCQEA